MQRLIFVVIFLSLGFFMQPLMAVDKPGPRATFFALSDIHFDPFYACQSKMRPCPVLQKLIAADVTQWSTILQNADTQTTLFYYQDSNFNLLKSTLNELSQVAMQYPPQFVIISGDFQSHDFSKNYRYFSTDTTLTHYHEFVKKFFAFFALELRQALPGIPIYAVLGNNDGYAEDYHASPNDEFFKAMLPIWSQLLANHQQNWQQDFAYGGYYTVTMPHHLKQRLIVLNTSFFSSRGNGANIEMGAKTQLNWLAQQLQTAHTHHEKVWLLLHIPPGIDVYKTSQNPFSYIVQFWHSPYTQIFLYDLKEYTNDIPGIFAGHIHADAFEIVKTATTQNVINITPAISPLFGNNPGFKVYFYDPLSFQIKDFLVYYLPNTLNNKTTARWQLEYDFNQAYQPRCTNCALVNGMLNLPQSGLLADAYQRYYTVDNPTTQPIHAGKWLPYYWCAIYNITKQDYENCLRN